MLSFDRIADGVPGAEGPTYDAEGRWFVASSAGRVLEMLPGGGTRTHAETPGSPSGLHADARGRLWLIDGKLGVMRVQPDGWVERLITHVDGEPLVGANDGVLDRDLNFYFTVPAGSTVASPHGRVLCRRVGGEVTVVGDGFAFCNGIAVSGDGTRLMVAETWTRLLIEFDLLGPGIAVNRRVFAELPGRSEVGADGITFDSAGRLISTNYGEGELDVFDPAGVLLERIELPFGEVTNVHLGGVDGKDLMVTEHQTPGVWRSRWHTAGLALPGPAESATRSPTH
ncbi:MAG: SMP-30/gluconolactonase/LRE family protein [Planctomycetota bacterium]